MYDKKFDSDLEAYILDHTNAFDELEKKLSAYPLPLPNEAMGVIGELLAASVLRENLRQIQVAELKAGYQKKSFWKKLFRK